MIRMAIVLSILASACAVEVTGEGDDDGGDLAAGFSDVGRHVISVLREKHGEGHETTWDVSRDNELAGTWILQTPTAALWDHPVAELAVALSCTGRPGCDEDFDLLACTTQADCVLGGTCRPVRATIARPGDAPRTLCAGHSDAMVDQVYDLIASAESFVDISSLTPPDGRFTAAIRNALSVLSRSGRAIRVRVLYGIIPGGALAGAVSVPEDVLPQLARELADASQLSLAVGAYRSGLESWDHAKIISIDHRVALVGGHNLLTRHYLQRSPALDLSMVVTGGAAAHASEFLEEMWRFTCRPDFVSTAAIATYPTAIDACAPLQPTVRAGTGTAGVRIIGVGRYGRIGDNAADEALVALIDAAQHSLRLSQQDIGGLVHDWPEPTVRALVSAVVRGVSVQLVISNKDAYPDRLTGGSAAYSNGWTPADVIAELAAYAQTHTELVPAGMDAATELCARFSVASLRLGGDDQWPDGAKFANHAKLVLADDTAFYIGSQNLYPANLAEYGYIVDDPVAAAQVHRDYFAKVWSGSQRTAVSGTGVPCVLAD